MVNIKNEFDYEEKNIRKEIMEIKITCGTI